MQSGWQGHSPYKGRFAVKWAGDREHVKGAGRGIGVKGNQQFHVGGEEAEDRCFPATAEMALVGGEVTQT